MIIKNHLPKKTTQPWKTYPWERMTFIGVGLTPNN